MMLMHDSSDHPMENSGGGRSRHTPYIRHLKQLDPDRFAATMRHVDDIDGIELSVMSWGGPVEFETEPTGDRYLVTVPLDGEIEIRTGPLTMVATPERAAIVDPDQSTWQRWSPDANAIWLHLFRGLVETEAQHVERAREQMVALPARQRVHFEDDFDLTSTDGRAWLGTLWRLINLLDEQHPLESIPPHRLKTLRLALVAGLLRTRRRPPTSPA